MSFVPAVNHKKPNQDDSLIPLINIVFLMLIFFMVAGHIEMSDDISIKPPVSTSEIKQEVQPITIIVLSKHEMSIENQSIALESLTAKINTLFERSGKSNAFSILLKVDAELAVEELQPILLSIKASGIKKVSLATQLSVVND